MAHRKQGQGKEERTALHQCSAQHERLSCCPTLLWCHVHALYAFSGAKDEHKKPNPRSGFFPPFSNSLQIRLKDQLLEKINKDLKS